MRIYKKVLALVLLIGFCFSVCPVYAEELSFELIYDGKAYENGQSIHYTGASVTVQVKSSTSSFELYVYGESSPVKSTNDGVIEYTLQKPNGPVQFMIKSGNVMVSKVVNIYHDNYAPPNALHYQSYEVQVKRLIEKIF